MSHNHNHNHNHSHNHHGNGNIGTAFFLNFSFTIIELIGGILTNSIAIISDAVHDFGDSLSLAAAWYFQKKSQKRNDTRYTYGYRRFSVLGAIITSFVLTAGSVYVLSEAIERLFLPQKTNAAGMFFLAIIGIAANGIAVLRTRKATSINERLVSLHLLEDVLGWIAVLIGSVIMRFTGWTVIDPVLSIAIACFVLINVIRNTKQIIPIILQRTPVNLEHEHITEKLKKIEFVKDIHDLHIWALDEEYNVLTVHIVLSESSENTSDLKDLKRTIREVLKDEGVQHATIEFEFPGELCELACI